mmetsp:Transcript_16384/g.37453  ORF Transcript_16384/g.37453 Transcript_16384/m.37453 type:complete len:243 (-) Transcript_16384:81-809(-)
MFSSSSSRCWRTTDLYCISIAFLNSTELLASCLALESASAARVLASRAFFASFLAFPARNALVSESSWRSLRVLAAAAAATSASFNSSISRASLSSSARIFSTSCVTSCTKLASACSSLCSFRRSIPSFFGADTGPSTGVYGASPSSPAASVEGSCCFSSASSVTADAAVRACAPAAAVRMDLLREALPPVESAFDCARSCIATDKVTFIACSSSVSARCRSARRASSSAWRCASKASASTR